MQLFLSDSVAGLFVQVLPLSLLVGFVFASARWRAQKKKGLTVAWRRELLYALFVCYVTGLVNLVLVPTNCWGSFWHYVFTGSAVWSPPRLFSGEFIFTPTFVRYLTGEFVGSPGRWVLTMMVGNFLMFLPMGVFLPLIFPKLYGRHLLLLTVSLPLSVELLQPVLGRSFDADDLLLNSLGILMGLTVIALLRRKNT